MGKMFDKKYLVSVLVALSIFVGHYYESMAFNYGPKVPATGVTISEPDGDPLNQRVRSFVFPNGTVSWDAGIGTITINAAVGPAIVAAPEKTTFVDADRIAGINSESSNALTWWSWANLRAGLKTYFDTLYFSVTGYAQVDTEAELITAISAVTPKIIVRSDITLSQNHTIPAGVEYSALLGSVITPHYSVGGGGSNWTVHAGSVYVSTADYNEIEFLRESGTALTEVAGSADVDAAGKWAWEGNKIYVWTTGSVDPDTLGADLLIVGHTMTFATGSSMQDNGGQMFDAAAGEVVGLNYASPNMFGENTSPGTTDMTAFINTAIQCVSDSGGGTVTLRPSETYLALSVAHKSNVHLIANGATITKNAGSSQTWIINMAGSESATTTTLTGNAAVGDTALSVTSSAGFAAGDYVIVYDATYVVATDGRNQELNRVASVGAGTITLQNKTISSYATASTATVTKLNAITNSTIEGGTWRLDTGVVGGGIKLLLAYGCHVKDAVITGPDDGEGVEAEQSAYCDIKNVSVRDGQNIATPAKGYGFHIGESSHNIDISHCRTENVRENAITANVRYSGFTDCTAIGGVGDGFNLHGFSSKGCWIRGCNVIGATGNGISAGYSTHNSGDLDADISGNTVINAGANGISVKGHTDGTKDNNGIIVSGNTIKGYGLITASSNGIAVHYSDNVTVSDNEIDGNSNTNAAYGIYFLDSSYSVASTNRIKGISNGYGIAWSGVTNFLANGNTLNNISSSNLRSLGTNVNVRIVGNITDDTTITQQAGEVWTGNHLGAIPSNEQLLTGASGEKASIGTVTELVTIAAAATTDTTIDLPANAIILGVSVRVTVLIPTAASFTVTGATTGTAFQTGASVAVAAGTTDVGTKSCPYLNASAQKIRITPNAQPADNTGRVRVTVFYIQLTAPTL